MTDQTKDTIERVRKAFNSPASLMGGESFAFRVEDLKALLSELDRLRRPIEAVEVATSIDALMNAAKAHAETWPLATLVYNQAADLLDRLVRENERLEKAMYEARTLLDDGPTALQRKVRAAIIIDDALATLSPKAEEK